jgi:membrane-associated phospholipid phosphatase
MLAAAVVLYMAAGPAELSYDLRVDLPVTVGLGAWWLSSEYAFKRELAPAQCRWCGENALDDAARAIRAPRDQQAGAARASDLLGVVTTPLALLGLDALLTAGGGGSWRDALVDTLLIVEAMVASQAVNQVVKFSAGRERPFVAALPAAEKSQTAQPDDNNLSFFSGHSSYTFSLVAASATIARARGYRYWWVVLAAGLPLAATTAVLRMVADEHYLTDVFTGASFGLLVGWAVPILFHRPVQVGPVTAALAPAPGGAALSGTW